MIRTGPRCCSLPRIRLHSMKAAGLTQTITWRLNGYAMLSMTPDQKARAHGKSNRGLARVVSQSAGGMDPQHYPGAI